MRIVLLVVLFASLTTVGRADPIKVTPAAALDKAAMDCATAFVKAINDKDVDAGLKLVDVPFREPEGNLLETREAMETKLKQELSRGLGRDNALKFFEAVPIEKFNDYAKKAGAKELSDDVVKELQKVIGTDGRIVPFVMVQKDGELPASERRNFLVRMKDGKGVIAGVWR